MSDVGFVTTIARRWRSPREGRSLYHPACRRSTDRVRATSAHHSTDRIAHPFGLEKDGGDEGTRTPDPLLAKEVLSQLSYIPVRSIVAADGFGAPAQGGVR